MPLFASASLAKQKKNKSSFRFENGKSLIFSTGQCIARNVGANERRD
jgi:hypothetical protein